MKILLAEDDYKQGKQICQSLEQEHYVIDWYQDGALAEQAYKNGNYDLFILDIDLPKKDGFTIIDQNKESIRKTPILFVSHLKDSVKGLNKGADDYIIKPFGFDELKARILSIIRRTKHLTSLIIEHRDITVNIDDNVVFLKGKPIKLPYKEFLLLKILILNKGRVLNREQIIDKLYSDNEYTQSNVLDAYVYRLRKIIGKDYIKTVNNIGYSIN